MNLLTSLLALFLSADTPMMAYSRPPTVNLTAIRMIVCDQGTGSGFMIDDDILVTAAHVAVMTNCKDQGSGTHLVTYHMDKTKDFALMTGQYPVVPYLKVNCTGYKPNNNYSAYGHSRDGQSYYLFRQEIVRATYKVTDEDFTVDGDTKMPGMRILHGYPVPGMSGGPVADQFGYVYGIVNAGNRLGDFFSFELKDTVLCKPELKGN